MAKRSIFREGALEKLGSPEQLDQLTRVVNPMAWLALAALGVFVVVMITWSSVVMVPEMVHGKGILVRSGGVFEVVATSDGEISDLSVRVGDIITEGQVVARIRQPELEENVRKARADLTQLETEQLQLETFQQRDAALRDSLLEQERASLLSGMAADSATVGSLDKKVEAERELLTEGLITRQALLETTQQRDAARLAIRKSASQLTQLGVQRLQEENDSREQVRTLRSKTEQARQTLAWAQASLRLNSEVTTAYTGQVLEVMAEQGTVVGKGTPILTVNLTGGAVQGLEAIVYVPSVYGKQVRPGMTIDIAPSTVKREEYGYLVGSVTYVSDFPASAQGMERVLKNSRLVQSLSGQDAPYEVHADLLPDPGNPSSYQWTSAKGPPVQIRSGTLADAQIVVQRRRPIFMLLPQLRQLARGGSKERTVQVAGAGG